MIRKEDFIKAIGAPDKGFEESVQHALCMVKEAELRSRRRKQRAGGLLAGIAAVIVLAAVAGFLLTGGSLKPQPDIVTTHGNVPQRNTPEPLPETEMLIIHDELLPTPTAFATPEPTRPAEEREEVVYTDVSISAEYVPEGHELFEKAFGQSLNQLYEGFEYTGSQTELLDIFGREAEYQCWHVSDGVEEICACRLREGQVIHTDADIGGSLCATLTVDMPDSPEAVEIFMDNAPLWLNDIYQEASAMADFRMTGIRMTFDTEQQPMLCEMFFGADNGTYMLWAFDEKRNGFELINCEYAGDEFVDCFATGVEVNADSSPEDYELFRAVFAREMSDLYSEFVFMSEVSGARELDGAVVDTKDWYYTDGASEYCPVWVSSYVRAAEEPGGKDEYLTMLSVCMPEDYSTTHSFMNGTADRLQLLYFKSRDYVGELYGTGAAVMSMPALRGVIAMLTEDGTLRTVGMYFGGETPAYVQWERDMAEDTFYMSNMHFDEEGQLLKYFGDDQQFTGSAGAPEENAMAVEYLLLFEGIFGQNPAELYPGKTETYYIEQNDSMYEVYIAGDVGDMKVLSIAEVANDRKLMTLYMPGDAQLSESFMSATLPQINSLYFDYTLPQLQILCKKNGIDADGMQLCAIVFVADDILSFCEMQFTGEYELSISWNISIGGEISLADCYIG